MLYVCLALPVVVAATFLVPPGQVPDETNHYLRAVQIGQGRLIGTRFSNLDSGGVLSANASAALEPFDNLKSRADLKLDPMLLEKARKLGWYDAGFAPLTFGNTVVYPPFFYPAVAVAVRAGRFNGLGVVDTLYLARLLNGLCALTVSALGIAFAVRGRALLFAVLILPGTLAPFGSASQDPLLIGTIALAAGLASRAAHDPARLRDGWRWLTALMLGAAASARPPYLPLLALLTTASMRPRFPARPGAGALLAAVAALIALLWIGFGALPVKVPFGTSSPSEQLHFILTHPQALPAAAYHSFERLGSLYYQQFIGVIGWVDTYFSHQYYALAGAALIGSVAATVVGPGAGVSRRERLALVAACLCAVGTIFVVQYLSWNPVGNDWIDGVHGRYLVPVACILALALPELGERAGPGRRTISALGWAAVIGLGILDLFAVPWVLLTRYHG